MLLNFLLSCFENRLPKHSLIFAQSCTIISILLEMIVMSDMENECSLVGCMREIPDPRAPYNPKHKFLDIIIIAVTAILCGMDTWNEIEDWGCRREDRGCRCYWWKDHQTQQRRGKKKTAGPCGKHMDFRGVPCPRPAACGRKDKWKSLKDSIQALNNSAEFKPLERVKACVCRE